MPDNLNDYAALIGSQDSNQAPSIYPTLVQALGYNPAAFSSPPDAGEPTVDAISSPDAGTSFAAPPNVPAPAPTPDTTPSVPALAPGQKLSVSAGGGAGISHEGFSQGAFNQIAKGPHAALAQGLAQDEAAARAKFAPIGQEMHSAEAQAAAAQLAESRAEADKITALSQGKQQIAQANQDFLAKEQAAAVQARVESQATMGQYRAALADYAAARVNPAQLWESAGQGGQFQMLATAFVHDFLGAKGIQTSGLDSIKSAIQQNIDSQLQNMRKKQEVAAGFKSLWDMQRAQSATDAEARARMNGFYLQGLTNQIDAQMGQYDSKLALVKGQAAVAKLQEEMAKNDLLVQKHVDDSAQARMKDRIQVYGDDLKAASERYSANAHIMAAKIAANAKEKPVSPLEGIIFDTSQTGGNFATRRFLPDVPPEARVKIRQQTSMVGDTVQNIEKLIQLQDAISKVPPTNVDAIKKLQSEEARTAELLRNVTKMGIIYDNSGKQINEQEVKLYDEIVGKKDWWTNGDNVRTLGSLAGLALQKNNAILGGVSTAITPGDPLYGFSSGKVSFDPGNTALTDIQSAPGAGRHQEGEADAAIKDITAPDAFKEKTDIESNKVSGHARQSWHDFATEWAQMHDPKKYGDVGAQYGGTLEYNPVTQQNVPIKGTKLYDDQAAALKEDYGKIPKAALALDKLAELAAGGDRTASQELTDLANRRYEAGTSTDPNDILLSAYAEFELSTIAQQKEDTSAR